MGAHAPTSGRTFYARNGMCARSSVPPPGGLSTSSAPSRARDAVAETAQAAAGGGLRTPHAVVGDLDRQLTVEAPMLTVAELASACLTTLVSASETKK